MARRHDPDPDRSDPAARAAARLALTGARQRRQRVLAAVALVAIGVLGVLVAEPVTGEPGPTVGAIVGALLLTALAVAVWPSAWSEPESTHHELEHSGTSSEATPRRASPGNATAPGPRPEPTRSS